MRRIINFFTQRNIAQKPVLNDKTEKKDKTEEYSGVDFLKYQELRMKNEKTKLEALDIFFYNKGELDKCMRELNDNVAFMRSLEQRIQERQVAVEQSGDDIALERNIAESIRRCILRRIVLEQGKVKTGGLIKEFQNVYKITRLNNFFSLTNMKNKTVFQTVIYSPFPYLFFDTSHPEILVDLA